MTTGKKLFTFLGAGDCAAFTPNGKRFATAGGGDGLKVRDAITGKEIHTLTEYVDIRGTHSLVFSPDGRCLAGVRTDLSKLFYRSAGDIKVWEMPNQPEGRILKKRGFTVAIHPDGKRIVMGEAPKNLDVNKDEWEKLRLCIMDIRTGRKLLTLEESNEFIDSGKVIFSRNGECIACAEAKRATVWDAKTGKKLLVLPGARGCVAFSPDGKRLATGGKNETIIVWSARSGRKVRALKGKLGRVHSVVFSPGGKRIAAAGDKNTIIWDAINGRKLLTGAGKGEGRGLAFSPSGSYIAVVGELQAVKVLDVATGIVVKTFRGHPGVISNLAFSPDGCRLAVSVGLPTPISPGETKIWDMRTGQEILTLRGHTSQVVDVAFSPDGKWLTTASLSEVIIWDGRPSATQTRAHRRR
jgi:WD40 repeat protein